MDSAAQTKAASQASLEPPVAGHQTSLDADLEQAADIEAEATKWPRKIEADNKEVWEYEDGRTWTGRLDWQDKPRGTGMLKDAQGNQWCAFEHTQPAGEFVDGQLCGWGLIKKDSGGYNYTGACFRGKPHGQGRLVHDIDGYEFDGGWFAGMKNGPGTEKQGRPSATSPYVWTTGCWNMGTPHGWFKETKTEFKNGDTHETVSIGAYDKGEREGRWTIKRTEAQVTAYEWTGEYVDGLKHGSFLQYVRKNNETTSTSGFMEKGKYEGRVCIGTYERDVFKGSLHCEYKDHRKNGAGKLDLGNGTVMEGNWVDDKQEGWFYVTVDGKRAPPRFFRNDEEDVATTNRLKRRADRDKKGKCKRLRDCEGCGGQSQEFCSKNPMCQKTHGPPGDFEDSDSDAVLTDIEE
tara:strand:+ start:149 stop:1363 length:1215 start_codon:yes stop_codon:yes gene_type:complete